MKPDGSTVEKIFSDNFKGYLSQRFPSWQSHIRKGEVRVRVWFNELLSELIKLALLTVVVCLTYIAGLYFLQGSWHLFEGTMIGRHYIEKVDAARAAEISWVLSRDFKFLGGAITLLTVFVSIVVGTVSQLTLLRRFIHIGRSSLVKLGWMALVCGVVALRLAGYYPMDFTLSFALCFLPTVVIFSSVLASTGKLLPELNLLLFIENYRERREIKNLKDDIAQLMNEGSSDDFD